MASITYFLRKRREGANFSLEQVFDDLALRSSKNYSVNQAISPYVSSGLFKRVLNVLSAPFQQGDINHVTGDINYVALLLNKRKTISTFLDLGILHRKRGLSRKVILAIWFKWPVKRSKWITVISEATRKDLLNNVDCNPEKIKVVYVPISSSFKRVDKIFNSDCPTIMQIGSAPNKNLKGLIAAVSGINCKLLIVGKISDDNLQLLKEGNIQYENKVAIPFQEIIESYISADILFFASTFEGFGMPILEAQAIGRPVITSNILSMPEVGGDAALYVDPLKTDEIRSAIIKVIENENLREYLILKGLSNVKRFDGDIIASQYEALYKNILEQQ